LKRRDVLRMAPLAAAAGAVTASGARGFVRPAAMVAPGPTKPGVAAAEIRPHNGSPALFLDGRPVFPAINWVAGPTPDGWDFEAQARKSAGTGIHIYAFDVGKGTEWVGPGPGRPDGFDFSTVEARFARVIEADPEALFHLRVYLEMGEWWNRLYPGEREITDDGEPLNQSYASMV